MLNFDNVWFGGWGVALAIDFVGSGNPWALLSALYCAALAVSETPRTTVVSGDPW